jgi:hypothetical protein
MKVFIKPPITVISHHISPVHFTESNKKIEKKLHKNAPDTRKKP